MDQKIFIDVSSILNSEIGNSRSFSINQKIQDFDKEIKIDDHLVGKVAINHLEENEILCFFDLQANISVQCVRCLKKFKIPLKLNYEQNFATKSDENSFPILGNKTIDVFPSIHQEILLSVPIKPLCKEKCKGVNHGRS